MRWGLARTWKPFLSLAKNPPFLFHVFGSMPASLNDSMCGWFDSKSIST